MPTGLGLILKSKILHLVAGLILAGLGLVVAAVLGLIILIASMIPAATAAPPGQSGAVSALGWANPAVGPITSPFGPRAKPCASCSSFHEGDDIGARCGKPIWAAHEGTVMFASTSGSYGNLLLIAHGDGLVTAYGHIPNGGFMVSVGEHVVAGQQVAVVGETGDATGCHLHFEVRSNGIQIDPTPVLRAGGIAVGVG